MTTIYDAALRGWAQGDRLPWPSISPEARAIYFARLDGLAERGRDIHWEGRTILGAEFGLGHQEVTWVIREWECSREG